MDLNLSELLNTTDDLPSFKGKLDGSEAFNELMDYGLLILDDDFLDLKMQILRSLIRRPRNFETLLKLGDRAIRSCIYNLEEEGFITHEIKNGIKIYKFNRNKVLFKIKKDIEENLVKLNQMKLYYSKNTLFECNSCNTLYSYPESMELDFTCCGKKLHPFNPGKIIENIMQNIAYVNEKLKYLEKIEMQTST